MKVLKMILILTLLMSGCSNSVAALEIVEPAEGQQYEIGSAIRIVVKPGAGEKWAKVGIGFTEIPYSVFTGAFVGEYKISNDTQPGEIELKISAISETNQIVELKRKIRIVLPSNVVLKGISVDPTFILLKKLPEGSDPNDIRISETESIGVGGMYSDGIERELKSSASGTTYTSSDETVVKVDKEGKVTAQGVGNAKITVKNGNFTATVDVIVKPYQ